MLEEYNCGRNTVFVNLDVLLCFVCPETLSSFAFCLQMQSSLEMRGFVDTVTSQASFCLAVTSGFNGFDKTKYLVLTHS